MLLWNKNYTNNVWGIAKYNLMLKSGGVAKLHQLVKYE